MQLIVNIGNSNIRFGVKEKEEISQSWTFNTKPYRNTDECFFLFKSMYRNYNLSPDAITHIVIGSVVPHQTQIIGNALERIHGFSPIIVDRNTKSAVSHSSNQMGTDLYANAVAAHQLYEGYKIILDFGTALTLTGIKEDGEVQGVIIAPGVITSLKALIGDTAQLPDIELVPPKSILGKDTVTCMQSGIVYGYLSMVEGLIDRINQEENQNATVISTGGLGHIFKPLSDKIQVDDKWHTLRGLSILGNIMK